MMISYKERPFYDFSTPPNPGQQLMMPQQTPYEGQVGPVVDLRFSRRVPIPSLDPKTGCDYVFYMQAERIQKMRMKRKNELFYRNIPGLCEMPRRRKQKSR